jgi:peptidoglycan/xylan/chitin deacetylase (PgdA/CDA1 family)
MCGRHIAQHPEIPGEVEALGHTVGNHTENHWNLDQRHEFDMVEAVGLAYQRLRDLGIAEPIPFRAPYGAFPRECADLLNAREELRDVHYGPVHWDIDAGDWSYWRDRKSASECADAYYAEIATRRRGIVLMHDSTADITDFQLGNRTLECVQLLIPRLKAAGMSFKTLAHAVGLPTRGGEVL